MIPFKKFIIEKWENSFKFKNKTYELFVNPSKQESIEILNQGDEQSFSFIIDFKLRKFYVWNRDALHYIVFENNLIPEFPDYEDYMRGKELNRFFIGHCDSNYKSVDSDSLLNDIPYPYDVKFYGNELIDKLLELKNSNMSFMNKWINEIEIKSIIDSSIDEIKGKLND